MRNWVRFSGLLAVAAMFLALAGSSQAAVEIDVEWSDGSTSTAASNSATLTANFFLTATGDSTVSGYQFTILWDAAELSYVDLAPFMDLSGNSLMNTGPNHPFSFSWFNGGGGEFFAVAGNMPAAISSSTLNTPADDITAAHGKVPIGSAKFHVEFPADDAGPDLRLCIDCGHIAAGDTVLIAGDQTLILNGANVDATAAAVCGDAVTDFPAEECDDGNTVGGDGCSAICELEFCGDGIVQPGLGEQCDVGTGGGGGSDGGGGSGGDCVPGGGTFPNECQFAFCGDGLTQPQFNSIEECDDGNTVDGDGCSLLCIEEICGDAITQPGLGEVCDDGNTSNSDSCVTCQAAFCGDAFVQAGVEVCDDGNASNTDACVACQAAFCGDAFVQAGVEDCDDGNTNDSDTCVACQDAVCGDAFVQAGVEDCDDGNTLSEDGCSAVCVAEECGDNVIQPGLGEECDDGNTASGDGCSFSCQLEICGNGVTDPFEECDDGNTQGGDGCSFSCQFEICGNGVTDPPEECDDGNTSNGDGCENDCTLTACTDIDADGVCDSVDNCPTLANAGQSDIDADGTGDVCDNCLTLANGPDAYASDLAPVPQCDRDSDGYGNACDGDFDNDGFVTPGDTDSLLGSLQLFFPPAPGQHDMNCDGFSTPVDVVLFQPQLKRFFVGPSGWACAGTVPCPQLCGNSVIDPGETCDDGNLADDDGCSASCAVEVCGDGITQPGLGEECDDGNTASGDGCSDTCTVSTCDVEIDLELIIAGNAPPVVDAGDVCDEVSGTCLASGAACTTDAECRVIAIGSADSTVGWVQRWIIQNDGTEELTDCLVLSTAGVPVAQPFPVLPPGMPWDETQAVSCDDLGGQGIQGVAIVCDCAAGGAQVFDTDLAMVGCYDPVCGDGITNGAEQCDDGNAVDNDSCSNSCVAAACGDGITNGAEECDDGNTNDTDLCRNDCTAAACGDGITNGAEECDDGNTNDTDSCSNGCVTAVCGDGTTNGAEQCDDGNAVDTDFCSNSCVAAVCGDGITNGAEQCDDGNAVDTDLCRNDCMAAVCGDGITNGTEQCDDGNAVDTDFCSNGCVAPVCGDGITNGAEQCDDANAVDGDGCGSDCTVSTCDLEIDFAAGIVEGGALVGYDGNDTCDEVAGTCRASGAPCTTDATCRVVATANPDAQSGWARIWRVENDGTETLTGCLVLSTTGAPLSMPISVLSPGATVSDIQPISCEEPGGDGFQGITVVCDCPGTGASVFDSDTAIVECGDL